MRAFRIEPQTTHHDDTPPTLSKRSSMQIRLEDRVKHLVGMLEADWQRSRTPTPVVIDTSRLINAHMLIAGMSGTGKSYQMMSYLNACYREGIPVEVFDVHEELHEVSGAHAVKFSAATRAGYNPLVPSLDIHSGGLLNQIDLFVATINRTGWKLGPRQESALRYLLLETYQLKGMWANNPGSWHKQECTEDEFDRLYSARNWQALKSFYPILRDVIAVANRKMRALQISADNKTASALDRLEGTATRISNIMAKAGRAAGDAEFNRLKQQLEDEKADAIESFANFINTIQTGREIQDIKRYSDPRTIESILERLERLDQVGIYNSNPPQWRGQSIRVHHIGSLADDPRQLLVYTRSSQILRECMDLGKTDTLRRVIMIDEGHLYYSEDKDNPINRISKEGRKFGLGLVIGSQSPTHFSEDFLTNCGTIMLTGLNDTYWDMACKKLRMDRETLMSTSAQRVLALKMHRLGEAGSRFQQVNVSAEVVAQGIQAVRQRHAA